MSYVLPMYFWPVPTAMEPAVPPGVCIFCLVRPAPNTTCGGMKHEVVAVPASAAPQAKRADAKLCSKCGLHPKNPVAATNGCEHTYGATS